MVRQVVHIGGPPRSGKTTLARAVAAHFADSHPSYLRFVSKITAPAALRLLPALPEFTWAERIDYSPDRLLEELPAALGRVRRETGTSFIVVESDTDPIFRLSHHLETRVFVMAAPEGVHEVFRSHAEAETALRLAMQDTMTFASEVFGMERVPALDDSGVSLAAGPAQEAGPPRTIDPDEFERLLQSSLGAEIAARVRLQPDYHSLVDADVSILNAGIGGHGPLTELCTRRVSRLIETLPAGSSRRPRFFSCNLANDSDPQTQQALRAIMQRVCTSGGRLS